MAKSLKASTGSAKLACCPEKMTPTLYLDFEDPNEVEAFKDAKIGDKVTVVVTGKLRSFSQREDEYGGSGSISLERMEVKKVENNVFAQLVEED